MRLKRRDVPAPAKAETTNAPREVGRRVEVIVDTIRKEIEKMGGQGPHATYEFEIVRDDRGFIKKIIARPMPAKAMN